MYYKQIIVVQVLFFSFSLASAQAVLVWDGGHHEFTAGIEDEVYMYNAATADISGGHISALVLYDTCMLDIYNDASFGLVRPEDSGLVNIYGGTITTVFALGSSHTNIYNGLIEELNPAESSTMNLYVESYFWNPTGGERDGGLLTGIWLNVNFRTLQNC